MNRLMFKKATLIITWIVFALTLIFILCAFATILNWFDGRETIGMITRICGYTILGLGAALVTCMLLDKSNFK